MATPPEGTPPGDPPARTDLPSSPEPSQAPEPAPKRRVPPPGKKVKVKNYVTYPARAGAIERALKELQYHDGGWPHQLAVRQSASSIVATAQVIEILRILHHQYDAPEITAGLGFLADQVVLHTQPVTDSGPGRGQSTRFPAFALWGLTRFPRAAFEPRHQAGLAFVMRWLWINQLKTGGWPVEHGADHLSLTMTAPVLDGLDRLQFHPVYGEEATHLAGRARSAIVRRAQNGRGTSWWNPHDDAPDSAATIHAVLALTKGGARQRALARRGVKWLMENPGYWVESIQPDRHLYDRLWNIMSFSLGLRAVLNPCTGVRPTDERLRPAVAHLSKLWVETTDARGSHMFGWADYPGGFPTTTGCFAVVMAVRALKRAHGFDPDRDILGEGLTADRSWTSDPSLWREQPDADQERGRLHSPFRLTLFRAARVVEITNTQDHFTFKCELSDASQWGLLEMLADQHVTAKRRDLLAQSISVHELAERRQIPLGTTVDLIDALNAELARASESAGGDFLPDLVEHIVPGETSENRYGFERVDIQIVDEAG